MIEELMVNHVVTENEKDEEFVENTIIGSDTMKEICGS